MTAVRRPANRVRIIGGRWRSRLVKFPPTMSVRPTPDRVRETLFNWLGQRLDGLACLDLFAGSGALGFEAMSRGAARVTMVERDREVVNALRANARELAAEAIDIVQGDALAFLANDKERYDVVFLDPPYASDLAQQALDRLASHLAGNARVYVETAAAITPGAGWRVLREDRAGAVRYALFEPVTP